MLAELQAGDPRQVGPYQLLGRLGAGGMGRVYLGRSAGGPPVAVKVVRTDLADHAHFRVRFRREVAAARKVSGPFAATVVDADVEGPLPWLATAYVAGPSLTEAVYDHGPLPVASVLALAAGLAAGLGAIHAAGVVHRDLKPSNVLLARDGPRVIDFGISRATEAASLTRSGTVMGSPGFMSPEQAEGRDVGPATDMFSLGAVLTFAATGECPFGTGPAAALVYRVVHNRPDIGQLPEQLWPLIGRCLAKDPRRRPTADQVLVGLGATHPAAGWLPAPVGQELAEYEVPVPAQDAPAGPAADASGGAAAASAEPPAAAGAGQAPQRRKRRPLIWAGAALGLLAAGVAAGVALADVNGGHGSPRQQDAARISAPAPLAVPASAATTHPPPSAPPTSPSATPPAAAPAAVPAPAPALAKATPAKPASPSPVVTPTTTPPPSPATVSVVVTASGGWVDAGIRLGKGDSVAISASGSWAAAGQVVTGPDGYAQPAADNYFNVADLGACATCASTQAPHWGALISYTGTSPPPAGSYTSTAVAPQAARIALAGSQSTSVPAHPGELWLAFNDDAYSGSTAGNSGQVAVTITVTRG